jgi:hypothetical protein
MGNALLIEEVNQLMCAAQIVLRVQEDDMRCRDGFIGRQLPNVDFMDVEDVGERLH